MSAAESSESPGSSGTRFGYLLAALVFFLVTTPFAMHTTLGQYRFRVLFSLVLIGGVATMRSRRKILIASFLAVPAIAGNWIATISQIEHVHVFTYSVSAIFLAYITVTIMASLLKEVQVTSDTVLGGVCVYLLVFEGVYIMSSLDVIASLRAYKAARVFRVESVADGTRINRSVTISDFTKAVHESRELKRRSRADTMPSLPTTAAAAGGAPVRLERVESEVSPRI